MKKVITWTAAALMTAALTASALAADVSHTVAAGDTMWKLASAYQVGTSEIIAANPQAVADYKGGKEKALGALVGQTMKAMKGKANPGRINELLREML